MNNRIRFFIQYALGAALDKLGSDLSPSEHRKRFAHFVDKLTPEARQEVGEALLRRAANEIPDAEIANLSEMVFGAWKRARIRQREAEGTAADRKRKLIESRKTRECEEANRALRDFYAFTHFIHSGSMPDRRLPADEQRMLKETRRLFLLGAHKSAGVDDETAEIMARLGFGLSELADLQHAGVDPRLLEGEPLTTEESELLLGFGATMAPGVSMLEAYKCLTTETFMFLLKRRTPKVAGGVDPVAIVLPADDPRHGFTCEGPNGAISQGITLPIALRNLAEAVEVSEEADEELDMLPDDVLRAIASWHTWLDVDPQRAARIRADIVSRVDSLSLTHGAALSFQRMCPPDTVRNGFAAWLPGDPSVEHAREQTGRPDKRMHENENVVPVESLRVGDRVLLLGTVEEIHDPSDPPSDLDATRASVCLDGDQMGDAWTPLRLENVVYRAGEQLDQALQWHATAIKSKRRRPS